MGVSGYDRNNNYVLGDDASEDGVKITSTTVNTKKCLDVAVNSSATVPVYSSETQYATFFAGTFASAPGNNKSMLSIVNTGTSVVKIREIRIKNVQNTAVTGLVLDFAMLRITGHSAGTSLTPETHDTNDSLASGITVRAGSTVSGESSGVLRKWELSSDEWGSGAEDVESNMHNFTEFFPLYGHTGGQTKAITVRQNQGVHIKCRTNSTISTFDVTILFTQE